MAEILIQWTSPNATRYAVTPSLRRRGDIRNVGPNGNTWGTHEDLRAWIADGRDPADFPDHYRIIRVQGISVPNMRKLERHHQRAAVQGEPEFVSEDPFVEEHRYAWRVNIRELPQPKVNDLRDDGYVQITKNQFIAAAVHKGLNVSFLESHPDGYGAPRLPGTVD